MKKIIEYIQENRDRYIGELNEFLRIPSVSTDPEHKEDVKNAADFVGKQLEEAGMATVEIFPTEGHPIVYAERLVKRQNPPFWSTAITMSSRLTRLSFGNQHRLNRPSAMASSMPGEQRTIRDRFSSTSRVLKHS